MCVHCRQQDRWEIVQATVKNDSSVVQYVFDVYTGRAVEIKPGETKQVSAHMQR
jgi:hypothetical protein